MLNPYPARIEELHHHLEHVYGQRDRQATEALLAALLDPAVTRAARPSFIIETDAPYRTFADDWFGFGGIAQPESLANGRVKRQAHREYIMNEWLRLGEAGEIRLYVESEWRRLPLLAELRWQGMSVAYNMLMGRSLRIRVEYPKNARATRTDQERGRDRAELERLTARVLDNAHRTELSTVPSTAPFTVPPDMLFWAELTQKAAHYARAWDALVGGITTTVRNVCMLYNEPARPADWTMAERLLRDRINFTTTHMILVAARGGDMGEECPPWDDYHAMGRSLLRWWRQELARLTIAKVLRGQGDVVHRKYSLGAKEWGVLIDRSKRMFA
jgi:hypothetical protein